MGIALRNAVDYEIYSLSVELRAASVCIFDAQDTGIPAYLVTYPVSERDVALSLQAT
jgi:hypothetical protein